MVLRAGYFGISRLSGRYSSKAADLVRPRQRSNYLTRATPPTKTLNLIDSELDSGLDLRRDNNGPCSIS